MLGKLGRGNYRATRSSCLLILLARVSAVFLADCVSSRRNFVGCVVVVVTTQVEIIHVPFVCLRAKGNLVRHV